MNECKWFSALVLWSAYSARSPSSACMYVCMYICMYGGVYEILWGMTCTVCAVWQVAGSSALSYCKGRVPYLVSGMKIYYSVQEEGDCASMVIVCSEDEER